VTLTASETQVLKPGDYRYQAFVTQASEKYLVSQGSLEVIANIATQPYCESAGKSSLQTIVDALEASIKGLATKNQLEVIVGNVQIRYMSLDEKVRAHEYFSRLLAGEKNREAMEDAIASGSGTYRTFGRPVKVRFRNP
jgi:hypothetical protein